MMNILIDDRLSSGIRQHVWIVRGEVDPAHDIRLSHAQLNEVVLDVPHVLLYRVKRRLSSNLVRAANMNATKGINYKRVNNCF